MLQCECAQRTYCSDECAAQDWYAGHSEMHVLIEPIDARMTTNQRDLFTSYVRDPKRSNAQLVQLITRIYPISAYPYQVRYQPDVVQPRLDLDLTQNRISVTVRSAAQRLCADYDGPWTPLKGGIRRWDTGAGKTLAIHSTIRSYRQELVRTVDPTSGEPTVRPRICLLVTEAALQQNVLKDMWGQNDANSEYIKKRIEDAGLLASDAASPFNRLHVLTARKLSNLLMGVGPAGRRLWMGLPPSAKQEARAEGLTMAPTAYRLVEGAWVRGMRSWSDEQDGGKSGYSQFMLWFKKAPADIESIIADLQTRVHIFPKAWAGATDWKSRAEKTTVFRVSNLQLKVRVTWKTQRQQPSADDWNYYVRTNQYLKQRLLKFPSFVEAGVTELRLQDWGRDKDEAAAGYRLVSAGKRQTWRRLQPGEQEFDWNPLDQVAVFIDEGHSLFDPAQVAPGERANLTLLRQALMEAPGLKVFFYSATVNFSVGLSMLEILSAGQIRALGELSSLDSDLIRQQLAGLLTEKKKKGKKSKSSTADEEEEPGALQFSDAGVAELSNKAKGYISDVRVAALRDYFADVKISDSASLDYSLTQEHAAKIIAMLRQKRSLASVQAALVWAPDRIEDVYKLNSKNFSPDALVEMVMRGAMPAALPLLKLLRKNDKRLPKQGITSSILDDEASINLWAAVLQAFGYSWIPVQRQNIDMAQVSAEKRAELDYLRSLGLPVPKEFRHLRLASAPMTQHSHSAALEMYGPLDRSAPNAFLVLSSSLIQQDPNADEPQSYEALVQQLLERRSFATRYSFHNTVAELRAGGLTAEKETTELKRFRKELKGHQLYLWPGAQFADAFDSTSIEFKQLRDSAGPVWFIRRREIDPFTDEYVMRAQPIADEMQSYIAGPMFATALRLCEFNIHLSEDEKQDMLSEVMELFNSKENFHEHTARFLLFGGSFVQGFDIYDTLYQNNVDVALTDTERVQRAGRYNRRDGMPNVEFHKRKIRISTLVARWPETVRLQLGSVFPSAAEQLEMLEQGEKESSAEFSARRARLEKRLQKQGRNYGIMAYEQRVLNNVEGDPLKNKNRPRDALSADYVLEPYEALRLLSRDPFMDTLNLVGAKELRKMAFDRPYTKPNRDQEKKKKKKHDISESWNFAATNWGLKQNFIPMLREQLLAREIILDTSDLRNPARGEILVKVPQFDDLPDNVKEIIAKDYVEKALRKNDKQRTALELIHALFAGESYTISIFRRMAKKPEKRQLFVGLLENGQPVIKSFRKLPQQGKADRALTRLFELGVVEWMPNFARVAKSRPVKKRTAEDDSRGSSKRPSTVVELTTGPTDELSSELEAEMFALQAKFIGAGEEELLSPELYSNVLEAAPFPDDEQELLEQRIAKQFKSTLQESNFSAVLPDTTKQLLAELYKKRLNRTALPARLAINLPAELRVAIIELYKYGITRWARALRLLARVYLSERVPAGTAFNKIAELAGQLFQVCDSAVLSACFPAFYSTLSLDNCVLVTRLLYHWSAAYSPLEKLLYEQPQTRLGEILSILRNVYLVDVPNSIKQLTLLFEELDKTMSERGFFSMHSDAPSTAARSIIEAAVERSIVPLQSTHFPETTRRREFKIYLQALLQGLSVEDAILRAELKKAGKPDKSTTESYDLQRYILDVLEIVKTEATMQILVANSTSAGALVKALIDHMGDKLAVLHQLAQRFGTELFILFAEGFFGLHFRLRSSVETVEKWLESIALDDATLVSTGFAKDGELIWLAQERFVLLRDGIEPLDDFDFPTELAGDQLRLVESVDTIIVPGLAEELALPGNALAKLLYRRSWPEAVALAELMRKTSSSLEQYSKIRPAWSAERIEQLLLALQATDSKLNPALIFDVLGEEDFQLQRTSHIALVLQRLSESSVLLQTRLDWLRDALAAIRVEGEPAALVSQRLETRIYRKSEESSGKRKLPKNFTEDDQLVWREVYSSAVKQVKQDALAKFQ
jgi:hypothetical protein